MNKLSLLILPALLLGVGVTTTSIKSEPKPTYAEGPTFTPNKYKLTADEYYAPLTQGATGIQLLGELRDLTIKNHREFFKWKDLGEYQSYAITDAYPDAELSETKFMDFYTQTPQDIFWNNGNSYDREHVWCANRSKKIWDGPTRQKGGGSDMHHIRASLRGPNRSKGDDYFAEFPVEDRIENKSKGLLFGYSHLDKKYSDYFEPLDSVKGDIARTFMYLFMHYNKSETLGANLPTPYTGTIGDPNLKIYDEGSLIKFDSLPLTEIIRDINAPEINAKSSFEILLRWHELDPVNNFEINRNNQVYGMQGNRNPFVDHPEWAKMVFMADGSEEIEPTPGTETTPSTPDVPTPPKEPTKNGLDEKTIIIITCVTAIVAVTLITAIILIVHANKKRK